MAATVTTENNMAKQLEWTREKSLPMVLPLLTFLGSLPWSWNATRALAGTVAVPGTLELKDHSSLKVQ